MWRVLCVQAHLLALNPRVAPPVQVLRIPDPHDLIVVGLSGALRVQVPPGAAADTIRWTLADEATRTVAESAILWSRSANGDTARVSLTAPRYGLFLLVLRRASDTTSLRTTLSFVPKTTPDPRLGLHLYDLRWLPPIGVGSVRLWDTRTTWADIQPGPQTFHWDRLDSLITAGTFNGV